MGRKKKTHLFVRYYKASKRYPELPVKDEESKPALIDFIQIFYPPTRGNIVRFQGRYISGFGVDALHEIAKPLYEKSRAAMSDLGLSTDGEELLTNICTLDDLFVERTRLIISIVSSETRISTPDDPTSSYVHSRGNYNVVSSKREMLPGLESKISDLKEEVKQKLGETDLSPTERKKIQQTYRELLRQNRT